MAKAKKKICRQSIPQQPVLQLKEVRPITLTQKRAVEAYKRSKNNVYCGTAGTGKTYLAMGLACDDVFERRIYDKIIIIRSTVQVRDMGHLPGNHKEKMRVYEGPYQEICAKLFNRNDAYDQLKNKGKIEFSCTSFIRGLTFDDCVIIVDECQSMTWHELSSIFTRKGKNCKMIFVGDTRQNDLVKSKYDVSGLHQFLEVAQRMESMEVVKFGPHDIVRSEDIKEFLLIAEELGF